MSPGFELRPFGSTGIAVAPLGMAATYRPGRKAVYTAFDEGINLRIRHRQADEPRVE